MFSKTEIGTPKVQAFFASFQFLTNPKLRFGLLTDAKVQRWDEGLLKLKSLNPEAFSMGTSWFVKDIWLFDAYGQITTRVGGSRISTFLAWALNDILGFNIQGESVEDALARLRGRVEDVSYLVVKERNENTLILYKPPKDCSVAALYRNVLANRKAAFLHAKEVFDEND